MITELDAIDAAEDILAQHWDYAELQRQRTIRALEDELAELNAEIAELDAQVDRLNWMTVKDVAIVLLAAVLLVAVGWNL